MIRSRVALALLAVAATAVLALTGSVRACAGPEEPRARHAADAGPRAASDAGAPELLAVHRRWRGPRIGAARHGVCRLEGGTLSCCGPGVLRDLRVDSVVDFAMSAFSLCFVRGDGSGDCVATGGGEIRPGPPGGSLRAVVAVGTSVCALVTTGQVICFDRGGRGPDAASAWEQALLHAEALAASMYYVFALADGDLWCWGPARADHFEPCAGPPRRLSDRGDLVALATSETDNVCVLTAAGGVLCAGGPPPVGYGGRDLPIHARALTEVTGLPRVEWLRAVGPALFCGGAGGRTTACWGAGPAPLFGLGVDVFIGSDAPFDHRSDCRILEEPRRLECDHDLFDGVAVDLPSDEIAGSFTIGCYVDGAGRARCRTDAPGLNEAGALREACAELMERP